MLRGSTAQDGRCQRPAGGLWAADTGKAPVFRESLHLSTLESRDRELLEFLQQSGGADIAALCDFLGVTRTAVRQRMNRLAAAGYVDSETEDPAVAGHSRGRPRRLFQVTAEGMHALGQNYRDLAVVLWQVLTGISDQQLRTELLQRVRDGLVQQFRQRISDRGSLETRVEQLADEMNSRGFHVQSEQSGELRILRETSCPFPLLAEVDETICEVEREVLEQVLGVQVASLSRCRAGQGCCEFQVLGNA